MKNTMKVLAAVMALVMVLALSAAAFAENGSVSLDQAKQIALEQAGVKASEVSFTKAYQSWDDGRAVYEIEFYVGNTEYDMDVDVKTGRVTDFSTEIHGGYGSFGTDHDGFYGQNNQGFCGQNNQGFCGWDDDFDDRYGWDRDYDDCYGWDDDFDDRYGWDRDYDDFYDWD
ncbi:MAG: PepSY domain-containing protein [Oscillospiraceae bacterium]|nr:PepSY domain-containing protein [Oscillospiraceae bacterium]